MRGFERRPSTTTSAGKGRAASALVLLVVAALVAGCGNPSPSGPPDPSDHAVASVTPDGSPAATPEGSAAPEDHTVWTAGVEIPSPEPVATFEPTEASVAGVLVDTAFRLTPLDGSDPVEAAGRLTADPALEMVATAAGTSALVTPVAPLRQGQRYRFSLAAPDGTLQGTWAVQAVAPLAVVATTPGTGSTGVPTDTGIEVTFNQYGVAASDAERFISVSPAVAGVVREAGRTVAFVPESPLAAGRLYTLTVRHGLPLAGTGMTLPKDVVVQFETRTRARSVIQVVPRERLWEFRPTERAVIPVGVNRWAANEDAYQSDVTLPKRVAVTVHRLPSVEAAATAWRSIVSAPGWTAVSDVAPVDTASLPIVLDKTLPLKRSRGDSGSGSLRLPAVLDAGWYVVTLTYKGAGQQLIVQSTDISAYTVVTSTRSLAWVNDLATGKPVGGATVGLGGKQLGATGADGIVVGTTPVTVAGADADPQAAVAVVRVGARGVFLPTGATSWCEMWCDPATDAPRWWVVFGPDRYAFRPTDTINAWGMLRDRASGEVPDGVEVVLSTWDSDSGAAAEIATRAAVPDESGAFMVGLPITDLPYGEYRLVLRTGGKVVAERGINVMVIEKPAWTLGLRTSRHAVVGGSSVRVTANAAFFEGTPVAGARLVLSSGDRSAPLVTGLDGTGTRTMVLPADDDAQQGDQWDVTQIEGRPRMPEEGEISGTTEVAVFNAGVILKSEATIDGTRLTASGTLHDVAFDRFEAAGSTDLYGVDPFGAVRPAAKVTLTVVEETWSRHKVGTEYDFITKRTVPVYEMTSRTQTLGSRTVTTDAGGRYQASWDVAGGTRDYVVTASASDSKGRRTYERASAAGRAFETENASEPTLEGSGWDHPWSIGERLTLTFRGGRGAGRAGTYLWTSTRAGLRSWALTTEPRWSTTFEAEDVPGFSVEAVRFNGKAYEPVSGETPVRFRTSDRALAVVVTPDRKRYAPGGRVTLDVRTTSAGKPVAASVYVGVIDQKLVAMGLVDDSDPLDRLYEDVGSGLIGIEWSHRDPNRDVGGQDTMGGGDGPVGRGDFRDWLVATLVRTGADGRASLSFDLSDDLTTWHAFASGVSSSLLAGQGEAMLPVSLPFFAELTVAQTYLAADTPIVMVRAYGDALAKDDRVTFTVSSDTLPLPPVVVRGKAFMPVSIPLPRLTVGKHRLRVEAVTGSGSAARRDVLDRTFTVVSSRTAQASVTYAALEGPLAVKGGEAGLTTLVLGDAGRGRVIPVLTALAGNDLVRGDRALAAGIATRVLRDTFGIEPGGLALEADLSQFQQGSGYSLFGYGSDELELSALAALGGDARLQGLDAYFADFVPTTREARIWALVGRAATGAPGLGEIAALAALDDRTLDETVALALAALAAGDEATAGSLLRDVLRASGQRQGPWVRIASPAGDDASILLTARLAIVAAWLGEPVAAELDAYLDAHPPRTTLVELERAIAAQGWVRRVPAASAVAALVLDGARSEIRLDGSHAETVVLTPDQLAGARLEPVSGAVLVTTRSERPLDPASLTAPRGQTISRTVKPAKAVRLTDAVVVTLKVRLAAREEPGCWAVTDLVPSGLVPVTQGPWTDDEEEDADGTPVNVVEAPSRVVGQRVDFCLQADPKRPVQTLRYVARVVTPGRYRWEETVLQSVVDPAAGTVLPATSITIAGVE